MYTNLMRAVVAVVLLATASLADAAFHLFRIEQIYTNVDGSVQFVVLEGMLQHQRGEFLGRQAPELDQPRGQQDLPVPRTTCRAAAPRTSACWWQPRASSPSASSRPTT